MGPLLIIGVVTIIIALVLQNSINSNNSNGNPKAENSERDPVILGEFKDEASGLSFKTIAIGSSIWMAENLNVLGKDVFTWETANTRCPKGWHLPSREEWNELINYVGGKSKQLISITYGGTDIIGFNANKFTPLYRGKESGQSSSSSYWTSTEWDGQEAYYACLSNNSTITMIPSHRTKKGWELQVRCVKDIA